MYAFMFKGKYPGLASGSMPKGVAIMLFIEVIRMHYQLETEVHLDPGKDDDSCILVRISISFHILRL